MFSRNRDDEPFHYQATIAQAMDNQRRVLREEINRFPEARLKATPLERLPQELAEKFSINIPALDESSIQPSRREIDLDISSDPTRMAFHTGRGGVVKATEITISVPYQGDAEVFRFHASSHTMEYPRGKIEEAAVVFRARGTNLDPAQVRREFDDWIAQIKRHLAGMTSELGTFNDTLLTEATSILQGRIAKLKGDDDLIAGLGFGGPATGRP